MRAANRNALAGGAAQGAKAEREEALNPKPATKWRRVLDALADGRRLHRFQAERQLHDHCLHSTVAGITRNTGLHIERRTIEVAGYMGLPTRVREYWLSPEERRRARAILR
ncbi:hypothetical protein [Thioalkalivibrio sp. ALMg9]|uniref:hypothetical protein n=1 Tax=Thioalkalivibrio sp. ALMg9 TaxID=1266912 RepID=UPI00037EED57|nr:hypothetical protein [Thioalkalivibrio sp. ALMg9]